jgi:hypothetical protein
MSQDQQLPARFYIGESAPPKIGFVSGSLEDLRNIRAVLERILFKTVLLRGQSSEILIPFFDIYG